MGNIANLIRHLIDPNDPDARKHQIAFYKRPLCVTEDFNLTPEEVALIFSMDDGAIADRTKQEGDDLSAMIEEYLVGMVSVWPKVGKPVPNPWDDPTNCQHSCDDEDSEDELAKYSATGLYRIFWSRPWPRVEFVSQQTAKPGDIFKMWVAGEGFLAGATVKFVHHSGKYVIEHPTAPDETGYRCCNFRRTYLMIPVFMVPRDALEGEYSPFVFNPNTTAHIGGGTNTLLEISP